MEVLSGNVRQKAHKSRVFNGIRKLALVFRAYPRALARHNTPVRIKKPLNCIGILVININDVVG